MSDPVHPAGAQTSAADKALLTNATPEAYQELQQAYDHFNHELFNGQLPGCLITLHRDRKTMSYFSPLRFGSRRGQLSDEISLNPTYFGTLPLARIMQCLVHEMVHQWQAHCGDPGRGRYHNKEFADKMESIGLIASSNGKPGGQRTGEAMSDYPKEGGEFEQAVGKLEASGFSLSWFDRFIHHDQAQIVQHSPTAQDDPQARQVNEPSAAGQELIEPVAAQDQRTPAAMPAMREAMMVITSPAEPPNRSNRAKYTCACGHNVWGKSKLRFMCMDCGKQCISEDRREAEDPPQGQSGGDEQARPAAADEAVPPWADHPQTSGATAGVSQQDAVFRAFQQAASGPAC